MIDRTASFHCVYSCGRVHLQHAFERPHKLTGENNANASARMSSFFVCLYMSAMATQGGRLGHRSVRGYEVCTEQ